MPVTLKDIAKQVGVHPSTVSRVLRKNEAQHVSQKTRNRIFAVAKELDYHPNQVARALRLQKTLTIGLILPDISNPFFSGIAHSIEMQSFNAGYNLVVCNTGEDQDREKSLINNLIGRGIDGLIIAPVQNSDKHIVELLDKNFPLVLVDRCFENMKANAVITDNEESAFNAVAQFVNAGHKRIGFISSRPHIYTIQKRRSGYLRAIHTFNLDDDPELICGVGCKVADGYESTLRLLSLPDPPTALLISGNMLTIGVLEAITERELIIPRDISIIGYTDSYYTPYLLCSLTTVSHPLEKMGRKAFQLLLKNMKSKVPLPFSQIVIKTELHKRASVDRPNVCMNTILEGGES